MMQLIRQSLILKTPSVKKLGQCYLVLILLNFYGMVNAQPSSTMSEPAKAAQKMQNRLYPQVQLPFSYNYNQNMGANNAIQQAELSLSPIIPVNITSQVQLILNPMLTYNRNLNVQQVTNQNQPLQLETFLAPTYAKEWYFGIGPYFQAPATNADNGSRQTGVGVSAGAFYTPSNWLIGGAMFNSWGIGSDLSGGTANVVNLQPTSHTLLIMPGQTICQVRLLAAIPPAMRPINSHLAVAKQFSFLAITYRYRLVQRKW